MPQMPQKVNHTAQQHISVKPTLRSSIYQTQAVQCQETPCFQNMHASNMALSSNHAVRANTEVLPSTAWKLLGSALLQMSLLL
jgi:hypothetical protein